MPDRSAVRHWALTVFGNIRVITNSFSAEYGMAMGSQMEIVSKGGTNAFHGSLFEFLRNSALDARNFFDRRTSLTPDRLPAFRRNNYGGSIGGPIRKDQTFSMQFTKVSGSVWEPPMFRQSSIPLRK